jgi:hypothetical protein
MQTVNKWGGDFVKIVAADKKSQNFPFKISVTCLLLSIRLSKYE